MSKFNITMIGLISIVTIFFGVNIAIKANYKIQSGDTVSISYDITKGDQTYSDQSASIVVGSNENTIFTDEKLVGVKYGESKEFDTTLAEDITIDEETTLSKGDEVSIQAKITNVVPAETKEDTSEVSSSEA